MIEAAIDSKKQLSIYTITGNISDEELAKEVELFYLNDPTPLVLCDFRNSDVSGLSNAFFQRILYISKKYEHKRKLGKTAFVVNDDISFGLGRMYQSYSEIYDLPIVSRIFKDFDEAKDWLCS